MFIIYGKRSVGRSATLFAFLYAGMVLLSNLVFSLPHEDVPTFVQVLNTIAWGQEASVLRLSTALGLIRF